MNFIFALHICTLVQGITLGFLKLCENGASFTYIPTEHNMEFSVHTVFWRDHIEQIPVA